MSTLTLIEKAFLLKKTAPFRSLTLDLLLPIADKLVVAIFDERDEISNEDEEAHRMYFIAAGTVKLSDQDGRERFIGAGETFFGDEALFSDSKRGYRALCVTSAILLTLSQTNLLNIISECPAVALGFLNVYAQQQPLRALLEGDIL